MYTSMYCGCFIVCWISLLLYSERDTEKQRKEEKNLCILYLHTVFIHTVCGDTYSITMYARLTSNIIDVVGSMRTVSKCSQGQNYECNFTWPMSFKVKIYIFMWYAVVVTLWNENKNWNNETLFCSLSLSYTIFIFSNKDRTEI